MLLLLADVVAVVVWLAPQTLFAPGASRSAFLHHSLHKYSGTWAEPEFTGTGFPGYGAGEPPKTLPKPGELGYQGLDMPGGFMINYHMYRNYWPLMALGRYKRQTSDHHWDAIQTNGTEPQKTYVQGEASQYES